MAPSEERRSGGWISLTCVLAVSCVLCGIVNIYTAHTSNLNRQQNALSAVNRHMEHFSRGIKRQHRDLRNPKSIVNDEKNERTDGKDDDDTTEKEEEEKGDDDGAEDGEMGESVIDAIIERELDHDEGQDNPKREVIVDGKASTTSINTDDSFAKQAEKDLSKTAIERLATLECERFGGPSTEAAQEMVYWQDIPSDTTYTSPFYRNKQQHARNDNSRRQYMTFEPDGGGWNNIRMAMETVIGLGIAMGRTIVMPPQQRMYLLAKDRGKQKTDFGFEDFFPIDELNKKNVALDMITTKEFLELEAMTGNMRNKYTGQVEYPPANRTDWDGQDINRLKEWLRNVTLTPLWAPGKCLAAFTASGNHKDSDMLNRTLTQIHLNGVLKDTHIANPTSVDAGPAERLWENLARRSELCFYTEEMQNTRHVHFMCYHKMRVRMLVHFYAFLFFEDWREDLWMKRFMRDHVRYIDEIQCAAARVVRAVREEARKNGNANGEFDSFHVRRGDFQFKKTRIEAAEIYENVKAKLEPGATIFIATDERKKSFFDALKEHYNVKFLDDFKDALADINTNHYGMIDQLVASKGRLFFGCYHSTFTAFIMRIRGYHSSNFKLPGYEKGELPSDYYYTPMAQQETMHEYSPLQSPFFNREFPVSWRDLDFGIGKLPVDMVMATQDAR